MKLKTGWLRRQLERAASDVGEWPEWMKELRVPGKNLYSKREFPPSPHADPACHACGGSGMAPYRTAEMDRTGPPGYWSCMCTYTKRTKPDDPPTYIFWL